MHDHDVVSEMDELMSVTGVLDMDGEEVTTMEDMAVVAVTSMQKQQSKVEQCTVV